MRFFTTLLCFFSSLNAQQDSIVYSISSIKNPLEVKQIILKGQRFKIIPSIVYACSNLELLDLRRNKIAFIEDSIVLLQKLKVLNLERNKIKTISNQLPLLKALSVLKLGVNNISELPENIGALKSLKEFSIWDNHIYELPESFYTLSCSKLDFRGMRINKIMREKLIKNFKNKELYLPSDCGCE